jgi:hypothetical protein
MDDIPTRYWVLFIFYFLCLTVSEGVWCSEFEEAEWYHINYQDLQQSYQHSVASQFHMMVEAGRG